MGYRTAEDVAAAQSASWDDGFLHGLLEAYYLTNRIGHDTYSCACNEVMRDAIIQRLVDLDEGIGVWFVSRVFAAYGPLPREDVPGALRRTCLDWPPYVALMQDKQREYVEGRPHGK